MDNDVSIERRFSEVEHKCTELEQLLNEKVRENKDKDHVITSNNNTIILLQKEIENYKQTIGYKENEIRNNYQQIKELESSLLEYKQATISRNDEVNRLKDELDAKDNELREVQNKLRDIQHSCSAIKSNEFRLDLECVKLIREKKVLEDNISHLESTLSRKNTDLINISNTLNNKIQDLECEQVIIKIDSQDKADRARAISDQLALHQEKKEEYLKEINKLESEMIAQKASLLKEIDDITSVKNKFRNQVDEYYDKILEMQKNDEQRLLDFENEKKGLMEEFQAHVKRLDEEFQRQLSEKDKAIHALESSNSHRNSVALIVDDIDDDDIHVPYKNDEIILQLKTLRRELSKERLKCRELDTFLKSMEQEREVYRPIIESQNRSYVQMQEAHSFLQQKVQEVVSVNSTLSMELREAHRLLEDEQGKGEALEIMKIDLSSQIKHLLKQQQHHHHHHHHHHQQGGDCYDETSLTAQDVISLKLVTFDDINGLQKRNMELLSTLRSVIVKEGGWGSAFNSTHGDDDDDVILGALSENKMIFEELMKQRQARLKAEDIIEDMKQQIHFLSSCLLHHHHHRGDGSGNGDGNSDGDVRSPTKRVRAVRDGTITQSPFLGSGYGTSSSSGSSGISSSVNLVIVFNGNFFRGRHC